MLRFKDNLILKTAIFMLVFMLGLTSSAFGQLSSGVPANFGIEADLYADTIEYDFDVLGGGHTTDDWFNNRDGAGFEGIGVIDITGWAAFRALILPGGAAANRTFVRRMAYPYSSVVNGYLLLDAVYARDNHSRSSNLDSTMFKQRDKNIDNPLTWDLGVGSVPNKNDIIDAYAHIRRDGDQPTDDLWLLTAMSTNVSNGDAHNDMEVFRTLDTLLSGSDMFNGPDSGHTAWKVVGGIVEPGDIIFSIDFENGGINPIPSIRIWIKDGDQAAISAANPAIQFSGVYSGGGEDAGDFGYAELVVPAGAAFARANGTAADPVDSTLAAPWGHLEGPQADFHDYVLALQMAETGLNLSALGLDPGANGDPCENLFGYVMFKTRSSQSFTASLKDYVGPFAFGQVIDVECEITPPSQDLCVGFDATFTSSATGGIGVLSYCWHKAPDYGVPCIGTGSSYTITGATLSDAGTYRVIVTDEVGCGDTCFAELMVNPPPVCDVTPPSQEVCVGFDATFTDNSTGGTGSYTYCWQKSPYSDPCISTTNQLDITGATLADAGDYRVIVTDEKGCADTCFAELMVEPCGCTFTMGGWGAPCPESQQGDRYSTQPGCIRDHYFFQVFPEGVLIGDPAGPTLAGAGLTEKPAGVNRAGEESIAERAVVDGGDSEVPAPAKAGLSFLNSEWYAALWTSASAVEAFLPAGSTPGVLTADLTNPVSTPAGVLAGQLLALRLNVEYTCAGIFDSVGLVSGDYCYGDFIIPDTCGNGKFTGMSVNMFLAIADSAVGGLDVLSSYGATLSNLNFTASCLNELFDDCDPFANMSWFYAGAGAKSSSDEGTVSGTLPEEFSLSHSYPNPFNPICHIEYALPIDCQVTLTVYNILGQKVKVLVDEYQSAGYKSAIWDAKDNQGRELTTGIYFYRIEAGDFTQSKKMVLMK